MNGKTKAVTTARCVIARNGRGGPEVVDCSGNGIELVISVSNISSW